MSAIVSARKRFLHVLAARAAQKGKPMATESIVDPKTGQKLSKLTKRKPKKEEPPPKKAEAAPPAPPKGKQLQIPGTERKTHKDIVSAAERLEAIVDEKKALKKREEAATAALIEKMKKHGQTSYIEGDLEVLVTEAKERVTVRRKQLESGDYE